ncbi:hypothetical protein [Mycobacterium sp.]|uniref:hypothetical protein n=1 Tax=Mycobacterium sp. TaxID=1785 RepID=UPI0011F85CBC|nr:hypothetical protein [Mycobacterium sp.]TAM64729.1 MAG: hypothetical protein EPN51_23075 [Mycobacterium sp.]
MISTSMRVLVAIPAVLAAGVTYAPLAHAGCPQGQVPAVAMSDGRLPSPICVPAGHIPPGYVDASGGNAQGGIGTHSGWKTGDPHDCIGPDPCTAVPYRS